MSYCLVCGGLGTNVSQRQRGGLLGKLRGPELVIEKCTACDGLGVEPKPMEPPIKTAFKPKLPLDENTQKIADIVREQVRKGELSHTDRPKLEESLQELTQTDAGVDELASIFLETPASRRMERDSMGERLAAVGRKDALFAAIRRSNAANGIGQRHSYWEEVLTIAQMFARSGEPDGIALALDALKNNKEAAWQADRIHSLFKESLQRASSKVSDEILRSLLRLPKFINYLRAGSYYLEGDDSVIHAQVGLGDVLQLANEEVIRRQQTKTKSLG